MSNVGASLIKMTLLAGGVVVGTLLARWLEEIITRRVEEQSEYDRTRYEQGLTPVMITPVENK